MPRHTGYHQGILNPGQLRQRVDKSAEAIARLNVDAIAVRGTSGLVVGGAVSVKLGIPLIVVRKPDESRHSGYLAEAFDGEYEPFKRWVALDDFIASGATMSRILDAVVKERLVIDKEPVAIVLHDMSCRHDKTWKGIPIVDVSDF